jgi:glutamate 5-kinase
MNNKSLSYKRIVLKFGTSLLTCGGDRLNIEFMSSLAAQVANIHALGAEVVLVTSGAVAAGRQSIKANPELKGIPLRQMLAAVGQARLMRIYEELFEKHGITVAQALLTWRDLSDRIGYSMPAIILGFGVGVVGIVNENDVVAIEELGDARFGDNDNLSAMVSNLVDADLLVILTDIGGLYTADPHTHPEAALIKEVCDIDNTIEAMAGDTRGKLGTGGMLTKIEAARLATSSGVKVVIADGREDGVIIRLAQGAPVGTSIIPSTDKLESRERWMLSGLCTHGCIIIDDGAVDALINQNKSLLPSGVREVQGKWERGDIVDIRDLKENRLASGISNYSSADLVEIKGLKSAQIAQHLGYNYGAEVIHRNNMVLLHRRTNDTGKII